MNITSKICWDYYGFKNISINFTTPKCRRTISVLDNSYEQKYFLAFPEIKFNLICNEFRDSFLSCVLVYKIKSKTYFTNLFNMNKLKICLGDLCLGDLIDCKNSKIDLEKIDLNLLVNKFLDFFWSSSFEFHSRMNVCLVLDNLKYGRTKSYSDYLINVKDYYNEWQANTLKDVNWHLNNKFLILNEDNIEKFNIESNYLNTKIKRDVKDYYTFYKSMNKLLSKYKLSQNAIDERIKHIWDKTTLSVHMYKKTFLNKDSVYRESFA